MLSLAYSLAKPLLFALDPERAHTLTLTMVERFGGLLPQHPPDPRLAVEIAGVSFPSPVGLAAGLDKEGVALPAWERLGFGFTEIGTITPKPQPGNAKPRIHRFPEHATLVNSMGFPSEGADVVLARLRSLRASGKWPSTPVGINIGKNKDTAPDDAHEDYAICARAFAPFADYLVVNVSSPNTPGLRALARADSLRKLLDAAIAGANETPVFVKVSPDAHPDDLEQSIDAAAAAGVQGVVAANTTTTRPEGVGEGLPGGLSGRLLRDIATPAIARTLELCTTRALPVIGVGGVSSPADAMALLDLGCAAVQLYTGLIFEGPTLPSRINSALAARLGA
ncbi:MAG: quinone-dependent dihydroorotate dehydrogenase [Nannocystaceae bacterium]|nr:quinone-dependent dihydroorotate dehydrogenase [bacterium]